MLIKQVIRWPTNLWRIFLSWKSFDKAMFIISIIGLGSVYLGYVALHEGVQQSTNISSGVTTLNRIQIFQLADRSMMVRDIRLWDAWDGADANAYEQLIKIAKDAKN